LVRKQLSKSATQPAAKSRGADALSVDDRTVEAMSLFVRWGRRELHDKTVAETGIDIDRAAAAILGAVYHHEPVRMSDLAEHLGLDRSTISRQVAVVVRLGYVRREGDSSDARAAMLSLTPHGQTLRRKLAASFHKICTDLIADWKREDRQEFARLLDKLADRFRNEGVY
jgi:DNA-binding MarR family transcriptional regulator